MIVQYCVCGSEVWSVVLASEVPHYQEQIICVSCGIDNSRRPPLLWRLRFGRYRLRRRIRAYGFRKAFKMGIRDAFVLDRERPSNATNRTTDNSGDNADGPNAVSRALP